MVTNHVRNATILAYENQLSDGLFLIEGIYGHVSMTLSQSLGSIFGFFDIHETSVAYFLQD